MNKFSIYILLIMLYLGLAASFSPTQKGTPFMDNEKLFGNFFIGAPLTAILIENFTTGFIIKTYYQRYLVVHGFKAAEEKLIRTSRSFYQANKSNLGMALFRRYEKDQQMSTLPLPPGSIFVGDTSYGEWGRSDSGEKIWYFHPAYQHFPQAFGWGSYAFTLKTYNKMQYHIENGIPFYGIDGEFGSSGIVSQNFLNIVSPAKKDSFQFGEHLKKLFFSQNKKDGKIR